MARKLDDDDGFDDLDDTPEKAEKGRKLGIVIVVIGVAVIVGCGGLLFVLATFVTPGIVKKLNEAECTVCRINLRMCHRGLEAYREEKGHWPPERGVAFLVAPWAEGTMVQTPHSAGRLTCPGVDVDTLAIGELPREEWWVDLDRVDGDWSAYAGRDPVKFPIVGPLGSEVLAACDNHPTQNHLDVTHVLYADGTIGTFSLEDLKRQGIVPEDADRLVVGPDSPLEELRGLTLD